MNLGITMLCFLERMKGFLYGAMDSKIFNRFASNYYDNELRAMVRTYYRGLQIY